MYTTHLDLNTDSDYLTLSGTGIRTVTLTGNYSACIDQANLETVYMDKNLAPGSAEGGSTARTSTHDTEETQNEQDDLCHNVLTGKVLGPAPVVLPSGSFSLALTVGSGAAPADGFSLEYVIDDWYNWEHVRRKSFSKWSQDYIRRTL